jgi:ornithine cyclodeaminase/alanine dehydrogenase-like protein (mu-crystallin family)
LGQLAAGLCPGRQREDERLFCINLGLALEDLATAILLYQCARQQGRGLELPL